MVGRYTCMAFVPEFPPSVIPTPQEDAAGDHGGAFQAVMAMGRFGKLLQRLVRGS